MKLDADATSICYFNGRWTEGAVPLMSSATNAAWLANTVFDGARAFEGVAPDLDLHCERVIRSAHGLNLQPTKTAEEILALALEGISFFPPGTPLYIRPMFWAESGLILIDPGVDAVRAGDHQDAAARSEGRLHAVACRRIGGRHPIRRRRTRRRRASIRSRRWPPPKRSGAASTTP